MGTGQDPEGHVGIFLQKTVTRVALRALYKHLCRLAPKVLPVWEQVGQKPVLNHIGRTIDNQIVLFSVANAFCNKQHLARIPALQPVDAFPEATKKIDT